MAKGRRGRTAAAGNAILSRYPILDSGMQQLPRGYAGQKRNYLWAKVDLGNSQALTVIATHLHHTEDAAGQALRLEQLPVLLDGWNGAARTVIVGDYNATPDSPEYAQLITAGLRDAFLVAGGKPGEELTFHLGRSA